MTHTPTETEVAVRNGPPPRPVAARPPGGGRGPTGLDERVRAAGGSFRYGPCGGGFAVVARIPHRPPVPSPISSNSEQLPGLPHLVSAR